MAKKKSGAKDGRRGPRHHWSDEDNKALVEILERMQGYKDALKERGQGGDYHFYDAVAGVLCAEHGIQVTGRAVLSRVYDLREKEEKEKREKEVLSLKDEVKAEKAHPSNAARLDELLKPIHFMLEGVRRVFNRQAVINAKLNLILRYLDMDEEELPVPAIPERHFEELLYEGKEVGDEQHQHTN